MKAWECFMILRTIINGLSWKSLALKKTIPLMIPSLKHQYLFKDFSTVFPSLKSLITDSNKITPYIQDVLNKKGRDALVEDNIYLVLKDKEDYVRFDVSTFFDKYLRAILDLANSNNIKVIYVIPTRPLEIYKKRKRLGKYKSLFTVSDCP